MKHFSYETHSGKLFFPMTCTCIFQHNILYATFLYLEQQQNFIWNEIRYVLFLWNVLTSFWNQFHVENSCICSNFSCEILPCHLFFCTWKWCFIWNTLFLYGIFFLAFCMKIWKGEKYFFIWNQHHLWFLLFIWNLSLHLNSHCNLLLSEK